MRSEIRQRYSRDKRDKANVVRTPIPPINRCDLLAIQSGKDAGPLRDVLHRAVLKVEHRAVLVAIRNLQREFLSVVTLKQEILIALTGQFADEAIEAVQRTRDGAGVLNRKPGSKRSYC